MATLVLDPQPAEIDALVQRREALGLEHRDEVWQGVLHLNPPPSYGPERLSSILHRLLGPCADAAGLEMVGTVGIGVTDEDRVPDLTLQRPHDAQPQCQQTAAIVVEIVSPGDKSRDEFDWLGLTDDGYKPIERSGLVDLGPTQLAEQIQWPQPTDGPGVWSSAGAGLQSCR